MRAIGGELGWLTWPLDQGDDPGVSISSPAPTFLFGICLRIKLRGEHMKEEPGQRPSAAQTFDHLTCVVSC